MRACRPFRKFIEIESNFPQSEIYEPYSRGVFQDFPKGVRDFLYLPEYKSAFIAQSDMNLVTRMDSYFTNVSQYFLSFFLYINFYSLLCPGKRKEKLRTTILS